MNVRARVAGGVLSDGFMRLFVEDPIHCKDTWNEFVGIAVIFGDCPIQLFVRGSERINWTVNAEQCAYLRSM